MIPEYYHKLNKLYEKLQTPLLDYSVPENYDVVDEYWIVPNFSKVQIREDRETLESIYYLIEPTLAKNEYELLNHIYDDLRKTLALKEIGYDVEAKTTAILEAIGDLMKEYGLKVKNELTLKMLYYFFRDFLGFGAIECLVLDPNIEDISCDGYNIPIYVFHRKYGSLKTNIIFEKTELDSLVLLLGQRSGKHVSYATPLIDATLPDGSRIQLSYGQEVTTRGSSFTIRKFRAEPFTPIDLMRFGTFNSGLLAYSWMLIENKMSIMVIGETAAGKTTTLNALMMFLPPEAKVVSIEDTREIQLYHENWIPGVTRSGVEGHEIDMFDLLRSALRQRPDYIIVGEVRGEEARTLFQAMGTGHAGFATFHSGDIMQLIYRLENEPLNVPRVMIPFLDAVFVQFMWVRRGVRKRRVREVAEILGIDPASKDVLVNTVFRWDPASDEYFQESESKNLEKIAVMNGVDLSEVMEEIQRRKRFLEMLDKMGVRDYREVTKYIHAYYRNPEKAFEVAEELKL